MGPMEVREKKILRAAFLIPSASREEPYICTSFRWPLRTYNLSPFWIFHSFIETSVKVASSANGWLNLEKASRNFFDMDFFRPSRVKNDFHVDPSKYEAERITISLSGKRQDIYVAPPEFLLAMAPSGSSARREAEYLMSLI